MRMIAIPAAFCLILASCERAPEVIKLAGETMGTTYHVTIVDPPSGITTESIGREVEATLAEVNASMSTWDAESEVSRFNALESTEPMPISEGLAEVIRTSNAIHVLSGGAFDITLGPLIDLWGFGAGAPGDPIPGDAEIEAALESVGQGRLIDLRLGPALVKLAPEVTINLSAIAKGYGIDKVAETLQATGIERYLVEIGGDLVTAGHNPLGEDWVIGIEKPDASRRVVEQVVPISDLGAATSGDYRNFFEREGIRYSHIINPATGRPITHRTTSVTVVARSAMLADGLATALLATGDQRGIDIAEENNIAALFIVHDGVGFLTRATSAFEKLADLE
jgi:FAD:protein FMN transferase